MTTLRLQDVNNDLQGRLALVTGSSGGIGLACAKALAAEGCDIILHYSSSHEKAESLASDLRKTYPSQLFVTAQADLTDREATRNLVSKILSNPVVSEKHNVISILVANAGLGRRIRDVKNIEEEDWDEMMEINIRSQFVVTKTCVEGMRAQNWGRVIFVGSIASRGSGLNGCHYAASKGALSSMALNLATLLAPEGVTVNVVSPAMIGSTGMIPAPKAQTWSSDCDVEALMWSDLGLAIASGVPVHRLGVPEEVGNVVAMFAKTGYMTGQDILLTGGLK
ncbi:short chain dehydrogenase [Pochonia chlamydosporia 170]|uniref:3-oxoacyl-[acyl-carrier-protein] reductase n=1 Tax=Pochonia chlamydosporia 170 TaxID=1380566 RepID=A0A179FKY0_METCM|nr:short chain dehydrogenase [Pochonia chlamydosporia 170]OAQ66214.1 short chain dehydrogenase [Pochonia chlamydosporia 170]